MVTMSTASKIAAPRRVFGKITQNISQLRTYSCVLNRDIVKLYLTLPRNVTTEAMEHVHSAVQWIFRAQDAFGTGGVARSYSLAHNSFFQRRGWIACYPETTGYIIPTVFDYARVAGSEDAFERAVKMADWECAVQLSNGAVQGGTVEQVASPAIFNTGQVIFGWVRAFAETRKEKYLAAAVKAGDFLLREQDEDGAWRKNLSIHVARTSETYTYNTRTAWALTCLSEAANDAAYRAGAVKNIEFTLRRQLPNGWFKDNCIFDATQPLVHTIAYCIRGIMEVGSALGEDRYVKAARKAADALIERQHSDGGLSGRFDAQWRPTVNYSCLTGVAQMAVIWGRLFQITGDAKYLKAMKEANHYLKRLQVWQPKSPDIHGGMCGSFPIHGRYGKYEILSWAVKFFIDSLLLEKSIVETPSPSHS